MVRGDVASVFSKSLQTGRFWRFEQGHRFGLCNGYRLFARFEALICYVMFDKNTGLARNYQGFDSYICHSRYEKGMCDVQRAFARAKFWPFAAIIVNLHRYSNHYTPNEHHSYGR